MPTRMIVQYAEVEGKTYIVCSICKTLSMMGQAYGPITMVYGLDNEPDVNNKMSLCYGCYMEQWVVEYPHEPIPSIIDGRVYPSDNGVKQLATKEDVVRAGIGVVGVNETEYQKWERALYQAKASGEPVEAVYNKLYHSQTAEIVGLEPA